MIEISPLMSKNQVKKSLFRVTSPHLPRLRDGALQTISKVKKDYLVSILVKTPIPSNGAKNLIDENVCYKMCVPICVSARVASSNIMKV